MAEKLESSHPPGVEVEDLDHLPLVKQMMSICPGAGPGFVRIQPYGHTFPTGMVEHLHTISNFKCYDDDVWISSYSKCGTTWTQEMVWCIANDIDLAAAKAIPQDGRVPFFEFSGIADGRIPLPIPNSFDLVANTASPRFIKTHLPFDMLPKQIAGKKLIYVTRNPRDACVSFYHHQQILFAYGGSFKDFAQLFMNGLCEYGPMIKHVLRYWKQRDQPNILFLTYEEMKKDLESVIRKVATFLNKSLTPESVEVLRDHLSFNSMKGNTAVNKKEIVDCIMGEFKKANAESVPENGSFLRKGEVGNWKEYLDEELLMEFQEWEKRELHGQDFEFEYE